MNIIRSSSCPISSTSADSQPLEKQQIPKPVSRKRQRPCSFGMMPRMMIRTASTSRDLPTLKASIRVTYDGRIARYEILFCIALEFCALALAFLRCMVWSAARIWVPSTSGVFPKHPVTRQKLLVFFLTSLDVVSSSKSSSPIDLDSNSIWQDIDDKIVSSVRKPQLLLFQQESEDEVSSFLLRKSGDRYLRGDQRSRERLRKYHGSADFNFPDSTDERHRLLISCDERRSQKECESKLLYTYGAPSASTANIDSGHQSRIEIVHNLESINSLAVDVDTETLGRLAIDQDFAFEKDSARVPLVIPGSMAYYQPPSGSGNRNLQNAQEIPWGLDAIRAQEVWQNYGVRGEGVKICVLDSGVQASHEDFRQSKFDGYYGNEFVSPHWYEDNKGHGTHIAGTIAASDNTIGIVGVAPEAETYIVRVFDDERNFYGYADGTAYSTDLIAAATICKNWGADIINASLGGSNYNRVEEEFFKKLYYDSGILTVAAAGNGGNDQNVYPAAYEGVLSVGAVDESFHMAKFSTWDPSTTDVLAPGVNILSTFKENIYATFSGTSMAAPHATGALALMLNYAKKHNMDISTQEISHILKYTIASIDAPTAGRKEDSNDQPGASHTLGVIDTYASINYLENYGKPEGRSPLIAGKYPTTNQCDNVVRFEITTDSKGDEIYYRLQSLSDKEVIWMKGPNTLENYSKYSEEHCFQGPEDCYQFDIRDKGRDGILEGPGIEIVYNGHKLYQGGNFGYGGMLKFGDCHDGYRL